MMRTMSLVGCTTIAWGLTLVHQPEVRKTNASQRSQQYRKGEFNTNSCSWHDEKNAAGDIDNAKDCEAAAGELGLTYTMSHSDADSPPNCYNGGGYVIFNQNANANGKEAYLQPLCKLCSYVGGSYVEVWDLAEFDVWQTGCSISFHLYGDAHTGHVSGSTVKTNDGWIASLSFPPQAEKAGTGTFNWEGGGSWKPQCEKVTVHDPHYPKEYTLEFTSESISACKARNDCEFEDVYCNHCTHNRGCWKNDCSSKSDKWNPNWGKPAEECCKEWWHSSAGWAAHRNCDKCYWYKDVSQDRTWNQWKHNPKTNMYGGWEGPIKRKVLWEDCGQTCCSYCGAPADTPGFPLEVFE